MRISPSFHTKLYTIGVIELKKTAANIAKAIHTVSTAFAWIGGIALFAMCLLTFVDVFMRYFFKSPITGSQEIVAVLLVLAIYGGLPCGVMQNMLVETDVITRKLPPKLQAVLQCFMSLVCTVLCFIMVWKVLEQMLFYFRNPNLTTQILKIHYGPFYAFTCFGCTMMGLELAVHTAEYFSLLFRRKEADGNE